MSVGGKVTLGKEKEETTLVGLMQILLGIKTKKTNTVDSTATNGW
jgi:hypothetical protein